MISIDPNTTVRELAIEVPNAVRVFERLGIDYCCGGAKPLADACVSAGIEVSKVVEALSNEGYPLADEVVDWASRSMTDLIEHIINKHHYFTRNEIARLKNLMEKVCSVHGEKHPELQQLRGYFNALAGELIVHMMKEEQVLFPHITRMEQTETAPVPSCFGSVANPINMMNYEHEQAGRLLAEMATLTNDYQPPEDACFSYRALYQGLREFEQDLHMHIHLESNILFPKAYAAEKL